MKLAEGICSNDFSVNIRYILTSMYCVINVGYLLDFGILVLFYNGVDKCQDLLPADTWI